MRQLNKIAIVGVNGACVWEGIQRIQLTQSLRDSQLTRFRFSENKATSDIVVTVNYSLADPSPPHNCPS